MNTLIQINQFTPGSIIKELNEPYYLIVLFDGQSAFSVDFNKYQCAGKNLLFLSPYQLLRWNSSNAPVIHLLKFHSDFYCIEYHKEEVACNGILFNNIFETPFIKVSDAVFEEINSILVKIKNIDNLDKTYNQSIAKSYLQLILALSSKEKQVQLSTKTTSTKKSRISDFNILLEKRFIESRSVLFYATYYGLSVDAFSKKVKKYLGKPPSKLIQEKLTLEAKKLLHLTHKSIKEIAADLCFEDEFYFSRYFKKQVGVSPKIFRKKVGISISAK